MARTLDMKTLTLEAARQLADAALKAAEAEGLRLHVTVVDAAGHVLIYQRMPGAPYPAREFSENKAFTALSFGKPTSVWKDRLGANPHLAAGLSRHPKVTMIGGGAPVVIEGEIVGAIGIAGGLEDQDIAIVCRALAAAGYDG